MTDKAREVLDGIKAQLAAVTRGPWEVRTDDLTDDVDVVHDQEHVSFVATCGDKNSPNVYADAEFIAAAPSTVARLTAALEAVLSQCDYLDTLADGDKHYAAGFRKLVEDALGTRDAT